MQRLLGSPKQWNLWVQPLFLAISDQRFGPNANTHTGSGEIA
jgi:hypothetical protein